MKSIVNRYKCEVCEHEFNKEQSKIIYKNYDGTEIYECPKCGRWSIPIINCEICGKEFEEERASITVCPECLEEAKKDYEIAMEIGDAHTGDNDLGINDFLLDFFSDYLEEILIKEIHEYFDSPLSSSRDVERYLEDKEEEIIEILRKRKKEGS
jgi:hypothetical protein